MAREKILSLKDIELVLGTKEVLKGINLDVFQGDIIGYIGPNGAGKSTTIKLLLGLIEDYKGEASMFGQDIKKAGEHYKARVGYVPESADMYDQLTACEYLTFIGGLYGIEQKASEEKALLMLEQFDMADVFHQKIEGYSKGMRQKVLLISSLLHNPDVLFLDEPLNGLDANSVIIIKEILRKLAEKGKTIFYSSHIMEVVENISNRIVLLANGKILADGTFAELKEASKQGSLEAIFNELTGFETHEETADQFLDIVTRNHHE